MECACYFGQVENLSYGRLAAYHVSMTAIGPSPTERRFLLSLVSLACALAFSPSALSADDMVRFNRDVRPILSAKCYSCHGPDAAAREAELRLDDEREAKSDRDGHRVIFAGHPEKSELIARITSTDSTEQMPPPDSGKKLSQTEIETLRRWIHQGADYEGHWAFIAPRRPSLPDVADRSWAQNEIDHFVLARLEAAGFHPALAADREKILRRASLDIRGLPPSLAELDRFLSDPSDHAFESAVDQFFSSPHYGEQRARYWLDAARFADTNGFFTDDERVMWPWRDWVIEAFNRNMPFDQFTVEQLAGDLLPNRTLQQQVATGFNRNHMVTNETGIVDEEYRVEYVVDRLNTTSTVWLGLTVGCARCHDHKFDPISQREFYELFAFFNSVPEKGLGHAGNTAPKIQVPSAELLADIEVAETAAKAAESELAKVNGEIDSALSQWATAASDREKPLTVPEEGLLLHFPLDELNDADGLRAEGEVKFENGFLNKAVRLDGDALLVSESELTRDMKFDRDVAFSYGAWIFAERSGPICILSKNDDVESLRGFDFLIRKGKGVIHLIHQWNSNAIQLMTRESIATGRWQHVMVTYDGSSKAAGVKFYVNGESQELTVRADSLTKTIQTDEPLRIGRRSTSAPFVGMIDDVRIYDRRLSAEEVRQLAHGQLVHSILSTPADKRSKRQTDMLRTHFLRWHAPPELRRTQETATELRATANRKKSDLPSAMVMEDLATPRKTFILERGQYDAPRDEVSPAVPASLPSLPKDETTSRLAFARWLVSPDNPLTARVTVNRIWQQYFGRGIVETVQDFGSQGSFPTHPDLLDWLAVELIQSGWDLQHIQRLIVTSATYQQSAATRATGPAKATRATGSASADTNIRLTPQTDRFNLLLGRGPRIRLDAEAIRDNALAISGLLATRVGGPSVRPYQPPGLWKAVSYDGNLTYAADSGDAVYRRGLYTFWKRQSPPPGMLVFDAPTRETCTVRRARTNTPLQALVLLNDPTYIDAAKALARRMLTEPMPLKPMPLKPGPLKPGPLKPGLPKPAASDADETRARASEDEGHRIDYGFRLATARVPTNEERKVIRELLRDHRSHFQRDPQAARAFFGDEPPDDRFDEKEYAAYSILANLLLNLDETIHK